MHNQDDLPSDRMLDEFLEEISADVDWDAIDRGAEELKLLYEKRSNHPNRLRCSLPNFGIDYLSVSEAARLVAYDRLDGREPGNDTLTATKKTIDTEMEKVVASLVRATDDGEIKAGMVRRTWNGAIDPDRTFINLLALWDWLIERSYTPGRFINAFRDSERDRHEAVSEYAELSRLRAHTPQGILAAFTPLSPEELSECDRDELVAAYEGLQRDFLSLANEVRGHASQNIPSERAETTYLNIIGGLVDLMTSGERPQFRKQSSIINVLVEKFGAKPGISERTLDTKLAEAKRSLADS